MMAIPIPLALSRVRIELKKAKATNIIEIKLPTTIIINPTLSGANISKGMPAPNRKANIIEDDNPQYKLTQIFFRLMG
jgi:hypothetical protein